MQIHRILILLSCSGAAAHPSHPEIVHKEDDLDRAFEHDLQKSDAVLQDFGPVESKLKAATLAAKKRVANGRRMEKKRRHHRALPRRSFLQRSSFDYSDDDSDSGLETPTDTDDIGADGADYDSSDSGHGDIDDSDASSVTSDIPDPPDPIGSDSDSDSDGAGDIGDSVGSDLPSESDDVGDDSASVSDDSFSATDSSDSGSDGGDFSLLQTGSSAATARSAASSRISPKDSLQMARDLEALRRDAIEEVALPQISERTSISPADSPKKHG